MIAYSVKYRAVYIYACVLNYMQGYIYRHDNILYDHTGMMACSIICILKYVDMIADRAK
jgi:hypothetical protein